jgi:hypothetical protein
MRDDACRERVDRSSGAMQKRDEFSSDRTDMPALAAPLHLSIVHRESTAMTSSASVAPTSPPVKSRPIVPPHHHSWLHSPPWYTAASVLFFLLFFLQPHSWRVDLWSVLRPLIDDERWFLLVGTVLTHTLVFVVANGTMALIYYMEHPFFEQHKIQPKPWPWKRGAEERQQYFNLIKKSLALIAFNQYVIAPVMVWFAYADQKKFGMNGDLSKVPHWYTSLVHIAISMVIEDTMFYCQRTQCTHMRRWSDEESELRWLIINA